MRFTNLGSPEKDEMNGQNDGCPQLMMQWRHLTQRRSPPPAEPPDSSPGFVNYPHLWAPGLGLLNTSQPRNT